MVVKAQIHGGGREKGGGIKIAARIDETGPAAEEMIGMNLITHQTGLQGRKVEQVLIEQALDIDRELYLSVAHDRSTAILTAKCSIRQSLALAA